MNTTDPDPSWPFGPTAFERRFGNLTTRVLVALIGAPALLLSVWFGGWAFFWVIALINIGVLLEFYWLTEKRGARPNKVWGVICGTVLVAGFGLASGIWAGMSFGDGRGAWQMGLLLIAAAALALVLGSFVGQFWNSTSSSLLGSASTVAGVAYVSVSFGLFIMLRQGVGVEGRILVTTVFICVWLCDSGAYFAGRFFGRHKLFERVSPKKTWEGAVGGAILAVAGAVTALIYMMPQHRLGLYDAVITGLIVAVFGPLGDLSKSQLKRDVGVKDSSNILPGHGGLLDRFDSILFVVPVVWFYIGIRAGL